MMALMIRRNLLQRCMNVTTPRHVSQNVSKPLKFMKVRRPSNLEQIRSCRRAATAGSVDVSDCNVVIRLPSRTEDLTLNHQWLRDHCRCNKCYNQSTNQRNLDLLEIPADIRPKTCSIEGETLLITWPDGHSSKYSLEWLQNNSLPGYLSRLSRQVVTWHKASIGSLDVAHIEMSKYINTPEGLRTLLESLAVFGVGIVTNVPPTVEATEKVVVRLANVQRTLFGDMWEFTNKMDAHKDTAFSCLALGAHTDSTYLSESTGLQIFHCLQHDGEGGETLLVDGFRAAEDLRQSHPESYKRLSETAFEAEYIEPGKHYSTCDTTLKLHPITGNLQQIRFNLYDRAPLSMLPVEKIAQFYEDLKWLARGVRDPRGEWWLKLAPGMVLFIDNWRVMHGRGAYTGLRRMAGCYVSRADYLSAARVHGILH